VKWVRNRAFAGSTTIAFTSYFAIFSIFFFVALYLEVVASVGPYTLALDFLAFLAGLGVLLTDAVISPTAGLGTLGFAMGIAGVGFGIIVVPINATALLSIPAANSGMAASTINTSRELGAVTGVAILGSIVNGQLTVNLTHRLIQIGIPPAFRQEIITAVITGDVNAKAAKISGESS